MAVNFRPLSDKVLVKPSQAEDKSAGGMYSGCRQAEADRRVGHRGRPRRVLDDGSRAALTVKVGDKVIYSKYGGTEVKLDGEEYMILDEDQIYAVSG